MMIPKTAAPSINVRRVIGAGPRAGQPRPAGAQVVDDLEACKKAALALRNFGYQVIGSHVAADNKPLVQIAVSRRCHEAIGDGEAEFYRRTHDYLYGRFREPLHGAVVVWAERVQP